MTPDFRYAREIDRAMEKSSKVPGLYLANEGRFLYVLSRRRGNIVEIGCWRGRTTSILLQAAAVWGATVTSIDPFLPMPEGLQMSTPEEWRSNLVAVGLTPPPLIIAKSRDAAANYSDEVSLLFIDGDHRREVVLEDLQLWGSKVKVGGVIALHDMFYPTITGVTLAVAEWWASERDELLSRWEMVGLTDYTVAFRRNP